MKITVLSADTPKDLIAKSVGLNVSFASVHMNCDLSAGPIQNGHFAGAFLGATSCQGAMSNAGVSQGVTAFFIDDPDGSYGVAMRPFDYSAQTAAKQAATAAMEQADRIGETPDLVWISATPGYEEDAIEGLIEIFGPDVPIIGGSAADNSVEGNWFVFDDTQQCSSGIAVAVMFPSTSVSFAYLNGYSPTKSTGIATRVSGRSLIEIDHRPAGQVYAEWTDNIVLPITPPDQATTILSESTFWPLGRKVGHVSNVPYYLLAHPATAHPDGTLDMFANIEQGEELTLMTGTVDGLADRAGRVAALTRKVLGHADAPVAGALMVYCGGCMLGVQDKLDRVVSGVTQAISDAPFLGVFTFGEQGALIGTGNRHGNLMISCIIFGED